MRNQIHKITILIGVIAMSFGMTLSGFGCQSETSRVCSIDGFTSDATPPSWQITKINAENEWAITRGGAKIIIAVLDTGIDESHKDLQGKVIKSVNFSSSPSTNDVNGHGTSVAGVIAAKAYLNGVNGIALESSLLNVKVASDDGIIQSNALAQGIIWATNNGANIINMSLVMDKDFDALELALQYAWSRGVVIVAAAGNNSSTKPTYPAASSYVIGVAATDENDTLAQWSNRGDWVSVSAPGVNIYTTMPNGKYTFKSGTCYATAVVSGEAALLCSVARDTNNDGFTNDEVREAIGKNVVMRTDGTNADRIDAQKAVEQLLAINNSVQ